MNIENKQAEQRCRFEAPTVEIIRLENSDIITVSGGSGDNMGEWDPQPGYLDIN